VSYDVALKTDGRSEIPQSIIVRIAPPDDTGGTFYEIGMMAQEPEIHSIVRERTSIPVAGIYTHDTHRRVIDRDFLIMEKLPGQALSQVGGLTHGFYDGVLEQVGRMLAELHRITRGCYGYLGAHNCMEPQADWPSAFRVMWNKLIDDIIAVDAYDEQEATLLRRLLDESEDAFQRPAPASLLHMDIWGQNILVDGRGRITGLVDWDRALWGDPEIEFAVLDYCGISEPAFWRGYGRERDLSTEAQLRGLFYYLYEVQKYIVIHIARRKNRASAMGYKANVMQIIERAFR
jgi:aminoglycoside phosphotransferase (APT) family kinase protein